MLCKPTNKFQDEQFKYSIIKKFWVGHEPWMLLLITDLKNYKNRHSVIGRLRFHNGLTLRLMIGNWDESELFNRLKHAIEINYPELHNNIDWATGEVKVIIKGG